MWRPDSWRALPIVQQPAYEDPAEVERVCAQVHALPPLVHPAEVEAVRAQLAEVAAGKRFLLQGGDCAERFADCAAGPVEAKLRILLQMSLVLTWGARVPTLRIARLAGQFSKPRSADTEVVDGVEVPVYRGENVNGFATSARRPDPSRLLQGYFHSAATLNYARAVLHASLGDLHHVREWDAGFARVSDDRRREYESVAESVASTLDFVRAMGGAESREAESRLSANMRDVFTSHEGLLLPYEQALTRRVVRGGKDRSLFRVLAATPADDDSGPGGPGGARGGKEDAPGRAAVADTGGAAGAAEDAARVADAGGAAERRVAADAERRGAEDAEQRTASDAERPTAAAAATSVGDIESASARREDPAVDDAAWYNLGAHFLWIGERTKTIGEAHVEYFRGIANPIGIKVGPATDPDDLVRLVQLLWPEPEACPGKIVLITRLGAARVDDTLPALLDAVRRAKLPVVWTCDPMHGNTRKTASGLKTRDFDDILRELRSTLACHHRAGSWLGGLHFELTPDDVTECVGGPQCLSEHDLPLRYTTHCDPRLNHAQAMELAFLVASDMRAHHA